MAHDAKKMAPALALMSGLMILSAPSQADTAAEQILQEIARLNQRLEQLEADNKQLKHELAAREINGGNTAAREKEIVTRLEDVERQVLSQDKQTRLLDSVQGVSAEASLLMVGQHALSGTANGKGESRINYRADVEVSLPAGNIGNAEGELFAHFRIGQGGGLSTLPQTMTGTPNSTTFALANSDAATALLAQVWYGLDVPLNFGLDNGQESAELEFNVGKIDPFVFFDQNDIADDESAAFLNNFFVHNPLLDSGGDMDVDAYGFAPGLRMAYRNNSQSPDYWQLSAGVFSSGEGSSFDTDLTHPFMIGQLEAGTYALFNKPGVYRIYAWNRGRAAPYANEFDTRREQHAGWGLSVNQQVA